jgi:hypothetical protein
MLHHTGNPSFWSYFRPEHRSLPVHLPHMVLADRFQPRYVQRCPLTQRTIAQLRLLAWERGSVKGLILLAKSGRASQT